MSNDRDEKIFRMEDGSTTTLNDFMRANDYFGGDQDVIDALDSTDIGGRYDGGGGASAAWWVWRVS